MSVSLSSLHHFTRTECKEFGSKCLVSRFYLCHVDHVDEDGDKMRMSNLMMGAKFAEIQTISRSIWTATMMREAKDVTVVQSISFKIIFLSVRVTSFIV